MTYQLDKAVAQKLKDFFEPFDFIDKVVIFGSRAKHNANPKSDIDLCIYSLQMSEAQFSKLKLSLEELPILYKIDVVHFEKSNEALRENVARDGKLLFIKAVKLEDVIELQNGYAFKSQEFKSTGIPVVRITNVDNNGLILDSLVYYNEDTKLEKFLIKKGDILLALTGDDKTLKICRNHLEKPLYLNQRVAILRAKEKIDQQYLLFAMKKYSKALLSKAKGIAQKNISADDINTLEISLPSLTKQQQIAQTLDKAQELIELRKASIQKLDELAQSIFIDMFGDPVENPKGWDTVKLGTIAKEVKYGTNNKSSDWKEGAIPVLRIPNIGDKSLNQNDMKYSIIEDSEYHRLKLIKGDLLFVRTNGNPSYIGKCISFEENFDCVYASYLIRVRLKNQNIQSKLIEFIVSVPSFRHLILKEAKTTAGNYNMNSQSIKNFIIINPPIDLQNKFAQTIEKIEAQKSLYEAELTQLQAAFDALMAQSFEG